MCNHGRTAKYIFSTIWPISQLSRTLIHIVWKSPKMSHLNFLNYSISNNFLFYLVTLFDLKLVKLIIFGLFNELLSTQNVNVARFARNVEWDFFYNFQTQWYFSMSWCQSTSSLSLFSPCHMYLSNPIINIFLMKVEAKFLFRCKKNLLIVIWKINVRRYWQIGIQ